MSEVTEEVKQQILEYLKKVKRSVTSRDIAKTLKLDKKIVDKAVNVLVNEGKIEWVSFGGETRVKVPEATE
ncbi:MAG: sulfite reductase [Aigarchaeota archaeon]|nr:sulfite reductase [Aigarchaeota archaeon]MCX8192783.1 sulfite reductase [Nitrososphaeria archaeon]MDW7986030.1 sulfite reductase [Nitrososphaerota archaeon]